MKKIIFNLLFGLAWGASFFTCSFLVYALVSQQKTLTFETHWFITQISCSLISGIGFTIPSIIYEHEKLSMIIKTSIHMGIGLTVYLLCAIVAGWIPITNGILPFMLIAIGYVILSFLIWFAFFLYNKKQAKTMNEKLKELN